MHRIVLALSATLLAVGCGPWPVVGHGDRGRVKYWLSTEVSGEDPLDEAVVITGAEQDISSRLRWPATWRADDSDDFDHALSGCDAEYDSERDEPEEMPDLYATVYSPGECVLETSRDGELFDSITLRFGGLHDLAIEARVEWPGTEGYEDLDPIPETLPLGTHLALDVVPYDVDDNVLVGRHDVWVRVDSPDGAELDIVDQIFGSPYDLDVPGTVTFHFEDDYTGVGTLLTVTVVE